MKTSVKSEYQAPMASILVLCESGVLCSSTSMFVTTDNFKIDSELSVEDYF